LRAGKVRAGLVHRFRSAAAFSCTGTASSAALSGDVTRHGLSRAGDRQLNCCLRTMAITQLARGTLGRTYYRKKRAAGKTEKLCAAANERRFDAVYRQLPRDATRRAGAEAGGTRVGDSSVQRGRLNHDHNRPWAA
jgi:transposase